MAVEVVVHNRQLQAGVPVYTSGSVTRYVGTTLRTFQVNVGDMVFDTWATVYDRDTREMRNLRCDGVVSIDASARVKRDAYRCALRFATIIADYELEQWARTPTKGKLVYTARGNKVPIGTQGVLLWCQFQTVLPRYSFGGRRQSRTIPQVDFNPHLQYAKALLGLGTKGPDNKFLNTAATYFRNLEVVNPAQYLTPDNLAYRAQEVITERWGADWWPVETEIHKNPRIGLVSGERNIYV